MPVTTQSPPRQDTAARRGAPLALAAVVTTVWAALVSLIPVVVLVGLALLVDPTGGATTGDAVRGGLAAWLLAHGVPLHTGGGPVALAPLAVSALAAWRVVRAGVHTARAIGARRRRSIVPAISAAAAVAATYGLLGLVAAAAANGPGLAIAVPRAGATFAGFGLAAALVGALVESGSHARMAAWVPRAVWDGLRTGLVAGLLVLGAGAGAAGVALALAAGRASNMLANYGTGIAGQVGLTLLCLAYTPNLAVWAASYLIGPGFAVGVGTRVSPAAVAVGGPVPAVPALAGLPTDALPAWSAVLLAVPLAAGMTSGWLLARSRLRAGARGVGWPQLLGAAALAGPAAGGLLGLAALASGGPLGAGRLAVLGPGAWPLAGVTAVVVGVGALVAAVATKALVSVRRSDPE